MADKRKPLNEQQTKKETKQQSAKPRPTLKKDGALGQQSKRKSKPEES